MQLHSESQRGDQYTRALRCIVTGISHNREGLTAEVSSIDYLASVKPAEKPSALAFTLMPFDVNHLSHRGRAPPPPPPDNQ